MQTKLNQRRWIRVAAATCTCGIMAGCAVSSIPLQRMPDPPPDRSAALAETLPSRAEVHELLGQPLISSPFWNIEVFREGVSQRRLEFLWAPLPTPMLAPATRLYRYTLVAYDDAGRATDMDSYLHGKDSSMTGAQHAQFTTLRLDAGGFVYIVAARGEVLLLNPDRRDAWLAQARSAPSATLVIGCDAPVSPLYLKVDRKTSKALPCRLFYVARPDVPQPAQAVDTGTPDNQPTPVLKQDTLALLRLSPGQHTLRIWGGVDDSFYGVTSEISVPIPCHPGELLFLNLAGFEYTNPAEEDARTGEWKVQLQDTLPPTFANRPLIIYKDGKWLAGAP